MWPLGFAELQAASNVNLKHFGGTGTETKIPSKAKKPNKDVKDVRTFACDNANCDCGTFEVYGGVNARGCLPVNCPACLKNSSRFSSDPPKKAKKCLIARSMW